MKILKPKNIIDITVRTNHFCSVRLKLQDFSRPEFSYSMYFKQEPSIILPVINSIANMLSDTLK